MDWTLIPTAIFLAGGAFFGLTGAVGILRMPDFYTRLHPAGKADTLAQTLFMIGLLFQAPDVTTGLKVVLVTLFLYLTAPTATHAITLAAHRDGLEPWKQPEKPGPGARKNQR
jgi:multicomponent Na+:H+ antiporter subunit G